MRGEDFSMDISREEIIHIAKLANLKLTEEEIDKTVYNK